MTLEFVPAAALELSHVRQSTNHGGPDDLPIEPFRCHELQRRAIGSDGSDRG